MFSITLKNKRWRSIAELARFLNGSYSKILRSYHSDSLSKTLGEYYYQERLLFPDLSPDTEHVVEDLWVCKCPVCGRSVLCTTNDLINYKHDEGFCIEHCVDEDC